MSRTLVTVGPTLPADEVRALLPGADPVPPIRFGDVGRWRLAPGDRLVVVDGYFSQAPPVRHRELLVAMAGGVEVLGCSSMGALRAAELDRHGMVGHGEVYRGLREGRLVGDDEVALVHGSAEDGWPVLVDAMVNLRATLQAAARAGVLDAAEAAGCEAVAAGRGFARRGLRSVLAAAGLDPGRAAAVRACAVDVKRADAQSLLALLAAGAGPAEVAAAGGVPYAGPPAAPDDVWTRDWARATPAADGTPAAADLLTAAALLAPDFPQWRHERCLRSLASLELAEQGWEAPPTSMLERRWLADHPGNPLADRVAAHPAGRSAWAGWLRRESAVATLDDAGPWPGPLRATPSLLARLEALAVEHLARHGALRRDAAEGAGHLAERAERAWLAPAERSLPAPRRHALVATRTLGAPVTSDAADPLLVDLLAEGLSDALAGAVTAASAALPPGHPGVRALPPQAQRALAADWAGAWHVEDPVVECRRRGLGTLPTLALGLRLVAHGGAAASPQVT